MTSKKIIIAIDGFSSTGKSTVAKQIAKHFNYVYVDTGAMYRCVALFALQYHFISKDNFNEEALIEALPKMVIQFQYNAETQKSESVLNGVNVEDKIRSIEVSSFVSQVAAIAEVREKLKIEQQKMGESKGVVMDGRDIGTVIFPNAELKLFMTASAEVRAQRRFDELQAKGDSVSFEEVLKNVTERDHLDMTRKEAPLVKAEDAVEIDNSEITREEQFEKIVELVNELI